VLAGCTPEKEVALPGSEPLLTETTDYPSYTALSMKYPDELVEEVVKEVPAPESEAKVLS